MNSTSMPDHDGILDPERLIKFLNAEGIKVGGDLDVELISGGKSNLTFRLRDGQTSWILRRPPLGTIPSGAHDVGREAFIMQRLASSDVPVPTVVAACSNVDVIGSPFFVMEQVDGLVLRTTEDVVNHVPDADRGDLGRNLVRQLATLHSVDPASVGLSELGRPNGYLERQVSRWVRQMAALPGHHPHAAAIGRALARSLPRNDDTCIVHGDYRLDNVIVDRTAPSRIRAVLDWEMTTLGDPLADLATLMMFWDQPGGAHNPVSLGLMATPGFPSRRDALATYTSARDADASSIGWYLAFSQFRLAVILEQIRVRHAEGATRGTGFDGYSGAVEFLLDQAMSGLSNGTPCDLLPAPP